MALIRPMQVISMKKRRTYLLLMTIVCCALAVLLAVSAILIYRDGAALRALDPKADIYSPQIVAEKLKSIAPLFILSLGLLAAGLALGIRDENAEKPVKDAGFNGSQTVEKPRRRGIAQAVILIVAAALIVAGIFNGSARDVLYKAISICTECVGLG